MKSGVTLTCRWSYTQTGGTLEIADSLPTVETLSVQGPGDNFNGGKIVFDSTTGFGMLALNSVTFNGVEIGMRINGTTKDSDQIECAGNVTIQGNSKLVVTAVNPVQQGSGIFWSLIKPTAGNTITGDFLAANITLPANVTENKGALPNSWQCNS